MRQFIVDIEYVVKGDTIEVTGPDSMTVEQIKEKALQEIKRMYNYSRGAKVLKVKEVVICEEEEN